MLTDEEIIKIAADTKTGEPGLHGYILPISFAREIERALLAKAMPIPKQEPVGICKQVTSGEKIALIFPSKALEINHGDKLYAAPQPAQAAAIPDGSTPSIEQQLEFVTAERDGYLAHRNRLMDELKNVPRWIPIEDPADMPDDTAHVLWDGCDISVDFTDTEVDYGTTFFSNGTEATHYLSNLRPPLSASPKPE